MTRRLLFGALCLLVATRALADGIFSPLPASQNGNQYTTNLNSALDGGRPIEPALSCFPWGYLGPVINHQAVVCHGCAATDPCTQGADDVIALGVGTGLSARWKCNQGTPAGSYQRAFLPLGAPVPVNTTPTTILSFPVALQASPTRQWAVHYGVTAIVSLTTGECDLALYLNGLPVRTAMLIGARTTTVTLDHFDVIGTTATDPITTTPILVAQADGSGTCTVLSTTSLLAVGAPATLVYVDAEPQ